MFDNVAFEVVIGLVFIYLLYSLLVTILGEIISNFIGMRARLLRVAVERMLNDGYYYRIHKQSKERPSKSSKTLEKEKADNESWWRGPSLKEHAEFKNSFAGKFYDYPAIKYLGRIEKEKKGGDLALTKPSYISADYFTDSLINFLADKGTGATLMEKIGYCLRYNPYLIQPNTRRQFINLFESSNTLADYKLNLIKWFNETMDRTTGWHKRKMRYLSFLLGLFLAIAFNVDTIKIVKILANDKEARTQLVNMGVQLAKDSARYKNFVTGNGDTIHPNAILDSGFTRLQKDINEAGFVLGLGWDFSSRTTAIRQKVNSDSLRIYATQLSAYVNDETEIKSRLAKNLSVIQRHLFLRDSLYRDTSIASYQINLNKSRGNAIAVDSFRTTYNNDTLKADSLQSLIIVHQVQLKNDSAILLANATLAKPILSRINFLTGEKFVSIDSIPKRNDGTYYIYGQRHYNWIENTGAFLTGLFTGLAGFLITALALSMGAPFWFDLLNKLISIRGVGIKPEEKKSQPLQQPDAVSSATVADAKKSDALVIDKQEIALDKLTALLKNENDIVGIALVPSDSPHLSVIIESEAAGDYLLQKYGALQTLADGFTIPIQYEVQPPIETHEGKTGGEIKNETGKLGFGTLGCFLKKKGSSKNYILSCWHVMKDNDDYNGGIIKRKILERAEGAEAEIAAVETGCLADCIDVGIALCNDQIIQPNPEHIIKAQHRSVTAFDGLIRTPVSLYGKVSKKREAVVFHHKMNVQLTYPGGKKIAMNDVFSIAIEDASGRLTSPTSPGDSGAVVMDGKGVPLGMIIGGNGFLSYAVKFSNMFDGDKPFKEYSFLIPDLKANT